MDLDILDSLKGYSAAFMDPVLWTPYIHRVCQKHKLHFKYNIQPGLAGTCPTFVVDERWVVKFFGRLFNGGACWAVERLCANLVQKYQPFPIAELLDWGELIPEGSWSWPYLIFEFVPGTSLGEIMHLTGQAERRRLAGWLGEAVRKLHTIPLDEEALGILPIQEKILTENRQYGSKLQKERQALPESWLAQVDEFLQATDGLVNSPWPVHLIHADLTRDHLLGNLQNGCWNTRAIIDFGDAMAGSLDYELASLHLDIFQSDAGLLKIFLDSYGLAVDEFPLLPYRCMRAALLHQFNLFVGSAQNLFLESCPNMEALAVSLWKGKS